MVQIVSLVLASLFTLYPNSATQHTADTFDSFGTVASQFYFEGALDNNNQSLDVYFNDNTSVGLGSGYYPMYHVSLDYDSIEEILYFNFQKNLTFNLYCEIEISSIETGGTYSGISYLYNDTTDVVTISPLTQSEFLDDSFSITFNFCVVDYSTINVDSTYAYNQGYNDGQKFGYQQGVKERDDYWYSKYTDDMATARAEGYQNGFIDGQASVSTDYGFTSLFLSIADTPVMMFRRLFDFSLFGTSMLAVVMSLFTCILLIHIVKKIIK